MSDDAQLIEAMARAMWAVDVNGQTFESEDEIDRHYKAAHHRYVNRAVAALAALRKTHVLVPREIFARCMITAGLCGASDHLELLISIEEENEPPHPGEAEAR